MKLIRENYLTDAGDVQMLSSAGLTFSSASQAMVGTDVSDPLYPPENVIDEHPKKVARSTAVDAVICVKMLGDPTSSIAVFNTNAYSARVEVLKEVSTDTLELVEEFEIVLRGARTYEQLITDRNKSDLSEFMFTWENFSGEHYINIYLTGVSGTTTAVEAGIVFIGLHSEFQDPDKGLSQSFKDYSVISELSSGATYILQRDVVRTFSFNIDMCEAAGGPESLKEIMLEIGPNPIPWVVSDTNDEMWLVFARKSSEPSGSFYAYSRVKISLNLIEVL